MRLIDADTLIKHLREYKTLYGVPMTERDKQMVHYVIGHIKNLEPTAYDVEKVVAELESFAKLAEDRWVNGTSNHAYQEHKCWVKAIDIVKRGGVE